MISFRNVSKSFKNAKILKDISMDIPDGQLTVLIGPSGCGKTTTLKMINRLLEPTSGSITIDGEEISSIDKVTLRRRMGYVIQQGGMFPHMSIRENIELIEKLEGKDPEEIRKTTRWLMEFVGMDPEKYLDRYPSELSGGQLQRIGVARAFANDPEIILLDEPFSALDPITRSTLQDELMEMQEQSAKTMVFVTHDMDEAVKIADRICIMNNGHILQYDEPEKILRDPADAFVENFVGPQRIWSAPEYIKVEDFMIKNPVTCLNDTYVKKCLEKMMVRHVDSLLVRDRENRLLGIIDKRALEKSRRGRARAADIMEDPVFTAKIGDSIIDILEKTRGTNSNNIPVLDERGAIAGLLTSSNLVATLSKQFVTDGPEEEGEGDA